MLILGIDPGETIGLAWLRYNEETEFLNLAWAGQQELPLKKDEFRWDKMAEALPKWYSYFGRPDVIAIEDYRIYRSMARMHSGKRVLTSALIGALRYEAARQDIETILYPAIMKGRWPDARLKAKFPAYFDVPMPHGGDALIIALICAEKKGVSF